MTVWRSSGRTRRHPLDNPEVVGAELATAVEERVTAGECLSALTPYPI